MSSMLAMDKAITRPALISDKVFAIRGSALERLLLKEGITHESVSNMKKIEKFVREL